MQYPETELIEILKDAGVDFVSSLPCEKIKGLICLLREFDLHVPVTREEEGVGISAGAVLAGRRPAMFIQSSGVGNMLNALLSLTVYYRLPLAVFVSRRGLRGEKIKAQIPLGRRLTSVLRASQLGYTIINSRRDFRKIPEKLKLVYREERPYFFLLNPKIWKNSFEVTESSVSNRPKIDKIDRGILRLPKPSMRRYEILKAIRWYLKDKVVVCNLGFPSKELYHLFHQPSNFYMLGSMGMATPLGLGIALCSDKEVVVIDGDGSLLMNPGTLATVAFMRPPNLTVLAIDNGVYGSTGCQSTHTSVVSNLSVVAKGFGIRNVKTLSTEEDLKRTLKRLRKGPAFVHIIALAGNEPLPPVDLSGEEIKEMVKKFISS
jgi:sulfopyruvate decarboxylase subunit beta